MIFEDLGEQLVKNIAHPIRAFRLRVGEDASGRQVAGIEEAAESPEMLSNAAMISELSPDTEASLELAFWESVKDGSPAELESYLERYPEGTFAPLARARLEAIALSSKESPAPAPAENGMDVLDLTFWNSVKDSNRREELEAYLEQHPNGHFAALTRARLSSPEVI